MSPEYAKRREYYRRRYIAKRAEIREAQRLRAATPEVKAKRAVYSKQYAAENAEDLKRRRAEWYAANKAKHEAWALANPERVREIKARYVRENPERVKASKRASRKAHPETNIAVKMRRRAVGEVAAESVRQVVRCADGLCAYCLQPSKLTVDHVAPVARGGTNDVSNLVAACVRCNSSKNARTPLEYMFGLPKLGIFR